MSVRTINVAISGDFSRVRQQLRELTSAVRILAAVAGAASFRRQQRLKLVAARVRNALGDDLDIQVVTMSDGVCRVVVRRLGGWA
jgi:hypothetical protein